MNTADGSRQGIFQWTGQLGRRLAAGWQRFTTEERGATTVIVAAMAVALMGFSAISLDAGRAYATRARLQDVADAASLAGAQMLPDAAEAERVAREYAVANGVADPAAVQVDFPDGRSVRVHIENTLPFLFAPVLGYNETNLAAAARATSGGLSAIHGGGPGGPGGPDGMGEGGGGDGAGGDAGDGASDDAGDGSGNSGRECRPEDASGDNTGGDGNEGDGQDASHNGDGNEGDGQDASHSGDGNEGDGRDASHNGDGNEGDGRDASHSGDGNEGDGQDASHDSVDTGAGCGDGRDVSSDRGDGEDRDREHRDDQQSDQEAGDGQDVNGGMVPLAIEEQELHFGDQVALKVGPGLGIGGNFHALALGGNGASRYETNLKRGYEGTVRIGDLILTEPGDMAGPTARAVGRRMGLDRLASHETVAAGSPRVVYVAVIGTPFADIHGRVAVRVTGFAAFFLEGVADDGTVRGRFLRWVGTGDNAGPDYGLRALKLTE